MVAAPPPRLRRNWYSNEPLGPEAAALKMTRPPLGWGLAGDGGQGNPGGGRFPENVRKFVGRLECSRRTGVSCLHA